MACPARPLSAHTEPRSPYLACHTQLTPDPDRPGTRPADRPRWLRGATSDGGVPACGAVKAKLTLAERIYRCSSCGLVIDRDINAARNLLHLAASGAERLNACRGTVRPSLAGHDPAKQEPGTAHAGKTGTAAGQPAAAKPGAPITLTDSATDRLEP
jgi:putative transposase